MRRLTEAFGTLRAAATPDAIAHSAAVLMRALGMLAALVVLVILARLLGPENFGSYSFILAVITLLSLPQVTGFRDLLVRELSYARARARIEESAGAWRWVCSRLLWWTVGIGAVFGLWYGVFEGRDTGALQIGLVIGIYLLKPVPALLGSALLGLGKPVQGNIGEFVIRPLTSAALIGIAFWWLGPASLSLFDALIIYAAALLVDAAVSWILLQRAALFRVLRGAPASVQPPDWQALRSTAMAFTLITGGQVINANLDIVMVGLMRTDTEVGVYRAAVALSGFVAFTLQILIAIAMPQMAALHAAGDSAGLQRLFTRSTQLSFAVSLIGFAMLAFAGGPLLALTFAPDYASGYTALVVLAFGQLLTAFIGPVALALNMTGHQNTTLGVLGGAIAVNFALNLWLVPVLGIEGAAAATTLSLIIWNLVLAVLIWRKTGYRPTAFVRLARAKG